MNAALWLLLVLRLGGWLRRFRRDLTTVGGAFKLAAGLLFFGVLAFQAVLSFFLSGPRPRSVELSQGLRDSGPWVLLAYCVLTLVTSVGEKAVSFTPAEVNLLFAGPFSRRQLLAYKLIGGALVYVLTAPLTLLFVFPYASWPLAALVGLVLVMLFLQLFGMTVALATSSLGVRASTGPRRLGLAVVVIVLILALLSLGGDVLRLPPDQIGHRLKEAPVLQALVLPLRWFIDAFQASRLWPDLTVAVAKCLGVLGILLLAVFGLDAHYLETAAAASERNYARLQRARSGGAAASLASGGKPRFGLPDLPYLGGVGPVLWRQLTAVLRSARGLIIFLTLFGGAMVAPAIIGAGPGLAVREAAPALVGTLVGMTVMVLMPMIPYDFRGDLDRFEVLKTLPAHSLALAVGQLLAPTLVLCVVQAGLLVAMQWLWGGGGRALWVVALLGPPFNFLAVGLENLLFLWFPSRLLPTAPGDFQMMGRQMLLFWAKLLVLGTTAGLTAGLVAAVYLTILPVLPLALMVGWLPLGVAAGGLVPFVAMAFRRFDVARDTPP